MSSRLKLPPVRDFGFYQRRKHDKWSEVALPNPPLEAPVADSHAHIHMFEDPAWELARCAANKVSFVCEITDPSEDGTRPFDELDVWCEQAGQFLEDALVHTASAELAEAQASSAAPTAPRTLHATPVVRIATGVHPHNAKLYTPAIERALLEHLQDERIVALGEIGLDFHYDFSPRETQREVFCRQLDLAKELNLPVVLHLRSGEDPLQDNAHAQAFDILQERGFPQAGTLLHCCTLPPDQLKPWIEAGCYIAYGGAATFKAAEAVRQGVRLVPRDKLLFETDSPYMTPEPMRGAACTPAHVIFTAAVLAQVCDIAPGDDRRHFLEQVYANTLAFYHLSQ